MEVECLFSAVFDKKPLIKIKLWKECHSTVIYLNNNQHSNFSDKRYAKWKKEDSY